MELFLIRHTAPDVQKGLCYGQSDIPVMDSFVDEAMIIKKLIPEKIQHVHSSPLKRCRQLGTFLFPDQTINYHDELMEINCGNWEMQHWDEIPQEELDPWMKDFVNIGIPNGESYVQLFDRVSACFQNISTQNKDAAIITHGGVIRSILSLITYTPLRESFQAFSLHYGCVVRLFNENGRMTYEVLSNIAPPEKEMHKPSSFSR